MLVGFLPAGLVDESFLTWLQIFLSLRVLSQGVGTLDPFHCISIANPFVGSPASSGHCCQPLRHVHRPVEAEDLARIAAGAGHRHLDCERSSSSAYVSSASAYSPRVVGAPVIEVGIDQVQAILADGLEPPAVRSARFDAFADKRSARRRRPECSALSGPIFGSTLRRTRTTGRRRRALVTFAKSFCTDRGVGVHERAALNTRPELLDVGPLFSQATRVTWGISVPAA